MSNRGIDYGLGQTNINRDTGIRFGVIPAHACHEWIYDDFEADYGPATCPKCGNEAVEGDSDVPLEVCDELYDEAHTCDDECRSQGCHGPELDELTRNDLDYAVLHHACGDYACDSCHVLFDGEDAFGDEPTSQTMDGEYKAELHSDGDIFILQSPYFTRAQFCSPCAPGACYLLNPVEDGARAYCFGHDMFDDGVAPYPVYSVATGELVQPDAK